MFDKAAALLHSLAKNHALVDGNKRTAWWCAAIFLTINDHPIREPFDEDAAEDLVLDAAQSLIEVPDITIRLRPLFE